MINLRWYQQSAYDRIRAGWDAGYKFIVAVLPTGAGKTVLFSRITHDEQGHAAVIAHRQELVGQMSKALAREGVVHQIIAPRKTVKNIIAEHLEEFGRSYYDPNAKVAAIGVNTLVNRADKLQQFCNRVTLWVIDECFPAGTLVDGKPIESICVGDMVTAFNEDTGEFEKRKVVRLFKNKAPQKMMQIRTQSHHVVTCTHGHPFWTKRGWVNACDLTMDDEVLIHELHKLWEDHQGDNGKSALLPSKNGSDLLHQEMWNGVSREKQKTKNETDDSHGLQCMRKTCSKGPCNNGSIQILRESVLFERVLKCVQGKCVKQDNGSNESEICVGSHEEKQPDALGRCSKESIRNTAGNGASTESSGWKWPSTDESGTNVVLSVCERGFFASGNCEDRSRLVLGGMSETLQNRLWSSEFEDRNRSGRFESLRTRKTRAGHAERPVSDWVGLDSIEVFESSDTSRSGHGGFDGYVYNIEVEELHTYVANGITVHNCHHVLESNQWGKAVELFPNARGLGVTATPERADGKGIGAVASGVFQHMVVGPTMRDLINEGFLTEYRIIAPPSNIDTSALRISKSTGDYNQNDVREAVAHSSLVVADDGKSRVIGDIVSHYLKFAAGKLGVTFVPDVDTATRVAEQYNSQGVPAAVVSAKTPDGERNMLLRKFRNRELLQLVNVDLFGEGFDLPAIEVVSMARPTASYGLYVQQFGRGLRLLDGKDRAIIIDHVGNVMRHGLPDAPREWSLLDRVKRSSGPSDAIPMRVCSNEACLSPYPRTLSECPECGTPIPPPAGRSAPEQVDGDLTELDPEILAQMRGEVARVDMPTTDAVVQYRVELQRKKVPKIGEMAHVKRFAAKHEARQQAVSGLRELMAWWAGHHRAAGKRDEEIFKTFYFKFGVDWLSAQSLDADKMCALSERVMLDTGDV